MLLIEPSTYLFFALLILTLPLDWLVSAMCAAVIHELCHILAIAMLKGRLLSIRVGIGGAAIETDLTDRGRELICVIAGPAGSFLLLLLRHTFPKLAICAMTQGVFNMLPIYPLDGGRALRCILELLCSKKADLIVRIIESLFFVSLLVIAFISVLIFKWEIVPLILAVFLGIKLLERKRPCKQRQNGLQ